MDTKIILVANRYQLDELAQIDPEYSQVGSLFAELASDVKATDTNIQLLRSYCNKLIKQSALPELSAEAMALLFHHLAAECEHQKKILFSRVLSIPAVWRRRKRYTCIGIFFEKNLFFILFLKEFFSESFYFLGQGYF